MSGQIPRQLDEVAQGIIRLKSKKVLTILERGKLTNLKDFRKALADPPPSSKESSEFYRGLFQFSGFPEPFSRGTDAFYRRWFAERKTLLLREDIRDASAIREISLLEHLAHLLPERIGSPLSLNALKEDIGVAFETVRDWLLLLEQFFYLFRIAPFTGRLARTLRKESKVYLFDWVEVEQESFVALHLLKAERLWKAMGDVPIGLNYIRDKEKREVDFILSERGEPFCLIECKASEEDLSPSLLYFQRKLLVPFAIQLLHRADICKKMKREGATQWVISADRWLATLP
jgi:predicted AAA+ superfamily ATPase